MWCAGRKQEDVAFFNWNVNGLAVFHYFENDVAFDLVVEFFAFVVVVIFARVGSAYDHYDEVVIAFIYLLVANGRFKQVTVVVNPFFKIKSSLNCHWYFDFKI